jgi:S-phase kinase-associated protein 1
MFTAARYGFACFGSTLHTTRVPQVIEYCKYHGSTDQAAPPKPEGDIKRWDADFIDVDKNTLFDLVLVRGD